MPAVNLWARWRDLMAAAPLLIADVVAVDAPRVLVEYPGGARDWVYGSGPVGGRVFIQSGKIIGEAPALALVIDEV